MIKCENHNDRVSQMKTKVAKIDAIREEMRILELQMGRAYNKYPPKVGAMVREAGKNMIVHAKVVGVYGTTSTGNSVAVCNRVAHKFYGALHPTSEADSKTDFSNSNNLDSTDTLGTSNHQTVFAVIDLGYVYKIAECFVFSACTNLKGVRIVPYTGHSIHPKPADFQKITEYETFVSSKESKRIKMVKPVHIDMKGVSSRYIGVAMEGKKKDGLSVGGVKCYPSM